MATIYCSYSDMVEVGALVENPRNPNKHPERQIAALAEIIKHQGWRNPIVVSRRSGFVVKGHGRLLAARLLGEAKVPVDYQNYDNEAAEWADMIADNKIAELSEMDSGELQELLRELDGNINLELTGFSDDEINKLLATVDDIEDIPESTPLDTDEPSTITLLPFISYGAKRAYMQEDEVARFEKFLKDFSGREGNYNGLVRELLEYGDSRFRQPKPDAPDTPAPQPAEEVAADAGEEAAESTETEENGADDAAEESEDDDNETDCER